MHLITLDFETYYDKEYSLKKLTTEEYIRDSRFEVIGLAIKVGDGETQWGSGTHEQIRRWLHTFDWDNAMLLAHNCLFDAAILSWVFDVHPKALADTLSMGRALDGVDVGGSLAAMAKRYGLGEKGTEILNALGKRRADFSPEELSRYGDYCINDVELTHALFERMAPAFPKGELKLIDLTLRMFTEPELELDRQGLEAHLKAVRQHKNELLIAAGVTDKKDLMSNAKFASLLEELGVTPPKKISPTTGKETYAFAKTDPGLKALEDHEDDRVQALVAARLGNKSTLEETRTERFIQIAERGKFPVPIKYYAAHTGRWGGCLVADTKVQVLDPQKGYCEKRIVDVLPDDLVWDGEAFVTHGGVVFSGYREVISWDGVEGTPDHVVFTDAGEISLREAMQGENEIETARRPTTDEVDAARRAVEVY